MSAKDKLAALNNPAFKEPGIFEKLGEAIFGSARRIDCCQIEVTSVCGGRCSYCPHTTQAKSWKSRHLEPEAFARLWPLLRQTKRAHLQGWGEPLLNPWFFGYQKLAAKAGCLTSTTSCGLKMDEEIAEKIAASGMDLIAFSLVGTDQESNAPRANVPFERVCESIRQLRQAIQKSQAGPEIHIAYLLLADRLEAAAALPELMDKLDVEMAVVATLDYLAMPEHSELAFRPDETEKIAKAREILNKAREKADSYGRVLHFALPGGRQREDGCAENAAKCLYIDAEGQVSPCVYLNVPGNDEPAKRRVFGNVCEEDVLAIWAKPAFRNFRKNLLSGQPDQVCLACPKRVEAD